MSHELGYSPDINLISDKKTTVICLKPVLVIFVGCMLNSVSILFKCLLTPAKVTTLRNTLTGVISSVLEKPVSRLIRRANKVRTLVTLS